MNKLYRNIVFDCKTSSISHIIYYLSFIIYYFLVSAAPATAQVRMRDVFIAMPDSVAMLVTRNNRLDCVDFSEAGMEARVRNMVDEYVCLEALTADYARFRTSAAAFMELRLMAVADSAVAAQVGDTVLCVVRTAVAGHDSLRVEDSNINFYTPEWQLLPREQLFTMPPVEDFVISSGNDVARVVAMLRYLCPVRMRLSADDNSITLVPQPVALERADRQHLRDVTVYAKGALR